jgi:two-component system sensor histidine kinase/response regulator
MVNILVIEDEPILRDEIVEWLILEGYNAFSASDGRIGVDAALSHLPDLIVCDILMPQVDGYNVLLEVHAHPATVNIPFIFLTAKVAQDEIRKGMDLGADDYITKPFTRLTLLHAIEARLAKKRLRTEANQQAITQLQHALTQASDHNILKAKLLAMFSHDFANSLSSILMVSSLLRNHIDLMDTNRRQTQLSRIESSVHLLLHMLDDLLVIAQVETGAFNQTPAFIPVQPFFQRLQSDCRTIYGDRCRLQLESQNKEIVGIDPRLLHLIASNLITHAIKVSPKGSMISFVLDGRPTECVITIYDQDTNLPDPERQRFFTALQQPATVDTIAILGLELAVVKEAVAFYGGSIQLGDQGEAGATITIIIPILESTSEINSARITGLSPGNL